MFRRIINFSRDQTPIPQNETAEKKGPRTIGYARATGHHEALADQPAALKAAGCTEIISDDVDATAVVRPGLQQTLERLRTGDVLVVWRLDRIARSAAHLAGLLETLKNQGSHFRSLEDRIDTTAPGGEQHFVFASALVAFERELRGARTREGIASARAKGVKVGRKPKLTPQQAADAKMLIDAGRLRKDVARSFGVSMPTLRRALQGHGIGEDNSLDLAVSRPAEPRTPTGDGLSAD